MRPREFSDYTWKDGVRITAGLIMLVLGLLGLVFPMLQGILFLIVAFLLLAPYSRTVRRGLAWFRLRFPRVHGQARRYHRRYWPRRRRE